MTTANSFDLLVTEVKSRVSSNPESLDSYLSGLGFSKNDRLYISYVAARAAANEKLQDKFLSELRTAMDAGFFTSNSHILEVARRDFVDAFEMRSLSEIARQTARTADEIVALRGDITPLVAYAKTLLPKAEPVPVPEVKK